MNNGIKNSKPTCSLMFTIGLVAGIIGFAFIIAVGLLFALWSL